MPAAATQTMAREAALPFPRPTPQDTRAQAPARRGTTRVGCAASSVAWLSPRDKEFNHGRPQQRGRDPHDDQRRCADAADGELAVFPKGVQERPAP